ncbi:MAG TPA: hypothetical protein VGD58_20210 [Herpetosiphonaceae bacterium]
MQTIIDHKYGKILLGLISFIVISALPAVLSREQGAPNPAGSVLPGASWLLQWVLVIAITRELGLVLLTPFLPAGARIWDEQSLPLWARRGATAFGFIAAVLYALVAPALM